MPRRIGPTAGSVQRGNTSPIPARLLLPCQRLRALASVCLPCVLTSNIPQASSKEASASRSPTRVSTGLLAAKPPSGGRGPGRGLPALFGFPLPASEPQTPSRHGGALILERHKAPTQPGYGSYLGGLKLCCTGVCRVPSTGACYQGVLVPLQTHHWPLRSYF